MADPLAISMAIITFAGAAIKVTNEITNLINGIKTVGQDMLSVITDVQDLEGILRKLIGIYHEYFHSKDRPEII